MSLRAKLEETGRIDRRQIILVILHQITYWLLSVDTKEPFDFWDVHARIERNNFKFKSLSCWSLNLFVGCSHACRYCYVPSSSATKQKPKLRNYGITDPDAQWGEYALVRPWDEKKFRASLRKAEEIDPAELPADGNRAVILCSTTDPYQVFRGSSRKKREGLNKAANDLLTRSLELILEESTLNVRILTRSPLVKEHFNLFQKFGNRLLLGMSLPTLDNRLAKVYEPRAPAPSKRLSALKAAREKGLHVYVAVAPTYPECDESDLRRTLTAVRDLEPATIFFEPINIRGENVKRIEEQAKKLGLTMRSDVFQSKGHWARYALESLQTAERLSHELGIIDRLHLWPDKKLLEEKAFLAALESDPTKSLQFQTPYEKQNWEKAQHPAFEKLKAWIEHWHRRRSEWPGQNGAEYLVAPNTP